MDRGHDRQPTDKDKKGFLMTLQSRPFHGDPNLEAAAVSDSAHILPGAVGKHVSKIQQALMELDKAAIDAGELQNSRYGPSTANAVLAYKKNRNIINRSYQTRTDNIVGKMTIAALDSELARKQGPPIPTPQSQSLGGPVAGVRARSLPPASLYAKWPEDLLDTLYRSYKAHGARVDGWAIDSLPEAFQFGMNVEPVDFEDALNQAHAERIKTVYDRVAFHSGLWPFVNFIFGTWETDNKGFKFSLTDVAAKYKMRTFLDSSPRFARDLPVMQCIRQSHPSITARV
jgi:hypothetical protein